MTTICMAGDTMLGRGVGERLASAEPEDLFSADLIALIHAADLFLCNLECCISDRGEPWPDPRKAFFFRAPPAAIEVLDHLGTDAVTLANNHALDYGAPALLDTLRRLRDAGIGVVGAGADVESARAPIVLEAGGTRIGVVGFSDHPADFAARPHRPGIAHADLGQGLPQWVTEAVVGLAPQVDHVLVTPHWGPNMTTEPTEPVSRAGAELAQLPVDVVAGHSAHVFHGVEVRGSTTVCWDLGDFIDDYAVDRHLRNDLGLLWLLELDGSQAARVEAVPIALDHCRTRLADDEERRWITGRFTAACEKMGTSVAARGDRLVVERR